MQIENNRGGGFVDLSLTVDNDEGVFLGIVIQDDDSLDEIADLIITDVAVAEQFLEDVTRAVNEFKERSSIE